MSFSQFKKFNQIGMGVDVSIYRLAKIVAVQKVRKIAGTISDNVQDVVYSHAQQLGPRNISLWSDKNERTIS